MNMIEKNQKQNKGFTLIELMVVIAIIAILAAAILVGVSGQRKKARETRVLSEVSGVIQPMLMCWSDGGFPYPPSYFGGNNICRNLPAYGTWPKIDGSNFVYYGSNIGGSGDWVIRIIDADSMKVAICCNSKTSQCFKMDGGTCDKNTSKP